MLAFFAQSRLGLEELITKAGKLDALALDPSAAGSLEELELALHLATKSIASDTAVAKKLKYEFLLWLMGKTDIRSAMAKGAPKDPENVLLIVFKEEKEDVLEALEANEKKKTLN